MKRIIFNGLTALSLLLCVATVVLWERSYTVGDFLRVPTHKPAPPFMGRNCFYLYTFASSVGRIQIAQWDQMEPEDKLQWTHPGVEDWHDTSPDYHVHFAHERFCLGFGWEWDYSLATTFAVVIPHWFIVVVTTILPFWWLRHWHRRRRRSRNGLCANCGYDLRATPDRCPECGMVVAANKGGATA